MSEKEYIEREAAIRATTLEVIGDLHPSEEALVAVVHKKLRAIPAADVVPKSDFEELEEILNATISGQKTLQKALAEANDKTEDIFAKIDNGIHLCLLFIENMLKEKRGDIVAEILLVSKRDVFTLMRAFVADLQKIYMEVKE